MIIQMNFYQSENLRKQKLTIMKQHVAANATGIATEVILS